MDDRYALLAALQQPITRSMRTVHLIVGVPGSGKSRVAQQVADRFDHHPHDVTEARAYAAHLIDVAHQDGKAILAEAPFRAQALQDALAEAGVPVRTYHLREALPDCQRRYEARNGRAYPAQHASNHARYAERAWDHSGPQASILADLRDAVSDVSEVSEAVATGGDGAGTLRE